MKNKVILLEDIMRVLYTLQNEGYIQQSLFEYILEEKYNVSDIEYSAISIICHQGDNKTTIWI